VSFSTLHQALKAKDAEGALDAAGHLRYVPLRYALRLTLLLADQRHPMYEAAARRFLSRVLDELNPPMLEAKRLADALAHVDHHYYGSFARLALQDVVGQLHRIESAALNIDFAGPFDDSPGKRRRTAHFEGLPRARPEQIVEVLDPAERFAEPSPRPLRSPAIAHSDPAGAPHRLAEASRPQARPNPPTLQSNG
jgi:hypothetical protein